MYTRDAEGITIRLPGPGKWTAIVGASLLFGGLAVFTWVIFLQHWSSVTVPRVMYLLLGTAIWSLIGALTGYRWSAPVVYRIRDGVVASYTTGFFRPVVRKWRRNEILQIGLDSRSVNPKSVQILFSRDGRWQRDQLTVRYNDSDPNIPDRQGSDRARWLALVLQRDLNIPPLADQFNAAQPAAATGKDRLTYGVADEAPPAVVIYQPSGGGTIMRTMPCGIWQRNQVQFLTACFLSAGFLPIFLIWCTNFRSRKDAAEALVLGIIAVISWGYVFWRHWSSTLVRAREGTITVYRKNLLGLQKVAKVSPDNTRELIVRNGANIVASDTRGIDIPLLVEDDPRTQDALLAFMRETLWPGQSAAAAPGPPGNGSSVT